MVGGIHICMREVASRIRCGTRFRVYNKGLGFKGYTRLAPPNSKPPILHLSTYVAPSNSELTGWGFTDIIGLSRFAC